MQNTEYEICSPAGEGKPPCSRVSNSIAALLHLQAVTDWYFILGTRSAGGQIEGMHK